MIGIYNFSKFDPTYDPTYDITLHNENHEFLDDPNTSHTTLHVGGLQ